MNDKPIDNVIESSHKVQAFVSAGYRQGRAGMESLHIPFGTPSHLADAMREGFDAGAAIKQAQDIRAANRESE